MFPVCGVRRLTGLDRADQRRDRATGRSPFRALAAVVHRFAVLRERHVVEHDLAAHLIFRKRVQFAEALDRDDVGRDTARRCSDAASQPEHRSRCGPGTTISALFGRAPSEARSPAATERARAHRRASPSPPIRPPAPAMSSPRAGCRCRRTAGSNARRPGRSRVPRRSDARRPSGTARWRWYRRCPAGQERHGAH